MGASKSKPCPPDHDCAKERCYLPKKKYSSYLPLVKFSAEEKRLWHFTRIHENVIVETLTAKGLILDVASLVCVFLKLNSDSSVKEHKLLLKVMEYPVIFRRDLMHRVFSMCDEFYNFHLRQQMAVWTDADGVRRNVLALNFLITGPKGSGKKSLIAAIKKKALFDSKLFWFGDHLFEVRFDSKTRMDADSALRNYQCIVVCQERGVEHSTATVALEPGVGHSSTDAGSGRLSPAQESRDAMTNLMERMRVLKREHVAVVYALTKADAFSCVHTPQRWCGFTESENGFFFFNFFAAVICSANSDSEYCGNLKILVEVCIKDWWYRCCYFKTMPKWDGIKEIRHIGGGLVE